MPKFTKASNLKQTEAKLKRIGRVEDVIETLENRRLTLPELSARMDIPEHAVERLLLELQEYGIITKTRKASNRKHWVYQVTKPSRIESLKADMMSSPQASD